MKKIFVFIFTFISLLFISSCQSKDDYKLTIVAPSGAPGVAIADIEVNYSNNYDITLNLTADALKTEFANKTSDVIIAPINLGATMYSKTQSYKLAAVLTWGNLFFASQKENLTIEDLNNASLTLFGQGTINDAIVNYVLEEKNITLGEQTSYLGSTQLTVQELLSNPDSICLVAEPALSTAMSKKSISVISVQELYKEVTNSDSYPQAGCFIKSDIINEHASVVTEFLNVLEVSTNKCQSDLDAIATYSVDLKLGTDIAIMKNAIPNSNIRYVKALDSKAAIEAIVAINPTLFGGRNPEIEFYYA